jgi:hypothetical protein
MGVGMGMGMDGRLRLMDEFEEVFPMAGESSFPRVQAITTHQNKRPYDTPHAHAMCLDEAIEACD